MATQTFADERHTAAQIFGVSELEEWLAGGADVVAARKRISAAIESDEDFSRVGPADEIYRLGKVYISALDPHPSSTRTPAIA